MISIIVAISENNAIGKENQLLWRISDDLKRFKQLTTSHTIIMGRKTFDSIGKPLPGRTTVIVTRNAELKVEGCVVAHSLQQAISACADDSEIFIVGGAELYTQALPLVDKLYITEIQQDVEGDAHFPEFDQRHWQLLSKDVRSQETPQPLEFHFASYQRIHPQTP